MKRLLLRITDACPSRCRHCLHECGPGRKNVMSPAAIKRCLSEARPEEYVIVTGGEASLYPALVLYALSEAAALGIPSWLNTNGFWGREPQAAAKYARSLKASGLAVAAFSIDGLHQEYIPFDHALTAVRACRDAGIPRVDVMATFVDASRPGIEVDQETRELVAKLRDEPGIRLKVQENVSFIGRACASLGRYTHTVSVEEALRPPDVFCPLQEEAGPLKNFCAETFYGVNPNGTVDLCDVSFPGNLSEKPFAEIVSEENVQAHPLLAALRNEGLAGLYRLACEHGFVPRAHYVSRCHFCQSAQQWLKTVFPEVVGNW